MQLSAVIGALDEVDVLFLRQLDRLRQAASFLADEQPMHDALAFRRSADGQNEQNRAFVQEMLHAVVEDFAYRRMVFSHHALHAVDRADHMGFVDHVAAADAYKEVLRVVRHADDLVRHNLPG